MSRVRRSRNAPGSSAARTISLPASSLAGRRRRPERKDERRHQPGRPPHREIAQDAEQRLVEAVEAVPGAIVHELEVLLGAPVVVIALEHGGKEIELGEGVGHAAGDLLLHLQPAAEQRHGRIGDQREGARGARKLAPPAARGAGIRRRRGEDAEGQIVEQRAGGVRDREGDMVVEGAREACGAARSRSWS